MLGVLTFGLWGKLRRSVEAVNDAPIVKRVQVPAWQVQHTKELQRGLDEAKTDAEKRLAVEKILADAARD